MSRAEHGWVSYLFRGLAALGLAFLLLPIAMMFPLSLEPALFFQALALATLTGLLAAFAPALRAARLDPVVAIRG